MDKTGDVGEVHADKARNIEGRLINGVQGTISIGYQQGTGVFYLKTTQGGLINSNSTSRDYTFVAAFDQSRVVPTGNYAVPRAFTASICVYLGA